MAGEQQKRKAYGEREKMTLPQSQARKCFQKQNIKLRENESEQSNVEIVRMWPNV